MRVLTVVGNRPQFVKAAAVSRRLRAVAQEVLVHTGQHYDDELSTVFFDELELPNPDHFLGIGGGTNTEQLARMLIELEPLIVQERPDLVLVYGDTNTTVAGSIAANGAGVPVVHVEAGMRSFDRRMPEEVNRVLVDHLSELLLCSSQAAAEHLSAERVAGRVEVVGDVMVDVAQMLLPRTRERIDLLSALDVEPREYILVTAHRAGNVDDEARLTQLVELLCALPEPAIFPLHPRTRSRLEQFGLLGRVESAATLRTTSPLGYLDFLTLLQSARVMMTDSGGVQKEAYLCGVPCVTMRSTTEWTETVDAGWNVLVDLDVSDALGALSRALPTERPRLYGDGQAGARVVEALVAHVAKVNT